MVKKKVTITNTSGLHARPAGRFVNKAKEFSANITLRRAGGDRTANAKSIVLLLTLGLGQGSEVEICAEGPDEARAVEALAAYIEQGLDEM